MYRYVISTNPCSGCAAVTTLQAVKLEDLPSAPNPNCLGGVKCRCRIVNDTSGPGGGYSKEELDRPTYGKEQVCYEAYLVHYLCNSSGA